ncbi:putative membrane protein [Clostridioides difficile CD160]|nr:putative membrane protein [Clostridioides difficile CD160]
MKTLKVFFCSVKYLILVFIFFINATFTSSATSDKTLDLSFKKIENNISSKITHEDTGIKIETNASKSDKERYLYIYQNIKENWGMYHNFYIEIQNKNESSQRINLSIQNKNMLEFRLKEGSEVFFEDKNIIYSDKIKDGCIEVPGEFEGKIYVNFNSFINDKSNVLLDSSMLSNIVNWGITFIPSDEGHNVVTIRKLSLLVEDKLESLHNIRITGDEEVQIPVLGQSISQYNVLGLENNSKIKYSLIEKQDSVNISQKGKLTLSDKAKPGQIILQVDVNDKFKVGKKITLTQSWSINKKDKDGVPYTLVSPKQSPTVQDMKKINFMNNSIIFIQILFISLVIICFGIYLYWKKHSKTK